jgi:hypothetical protein
MPKKKDHVMTKNIPAFIARTQFGQILERASKNNERFLVTKKGGESHHLRGGGLLADNRGNPRLPLHPAEGDPKERSGQTHPGRD